MYQRRWFCVLLSLCLLANAFCFPFSLPRIKRQAADNQTSNAISPVTDDDDDDFDEPISVTNSGGGGGGGSGIFSLLNLLTSILPSSSGSNFESLREHYLSFTVSLDDTNELKPPTFLRQEESDGESDDTSDRSDSESDDDDAAEESIEESDTKENSEASASVTNDNNDSDYDSDEPPGGGDGQGGGLLGVLAGLSGGEDGQSDLGSLLAAVSGIIANLSGDGIDLNSLIGSGIGLFVGLLSQDEQNPGDVIASYLLTSLDTITGGGSKNNGAFFGKFLSKLITGTSAGGDPDAESVENGEVMKDSAGFYGSFLMALLGDMSKGSSSSHPWE